MNSGLQNKMYKYEVAPPAGVWNRIAKELDDAALENKFPITLKNMEVMPAAIAWQNIIAGLDESLLVEDYASRLSNLSVAPPTDSWQNISAALNESMLIADYSKKLSALSIPPPHTTWNKIKAQLDSAAENDVQERRKIGPFLKYAAAASIIGLMTWGAFQLFNNKKEEIPIAKENTTIENKNSNIKTIVISDNNIAIDDLTASLEEARNDAALEASKKTYAKLDVKFAKSKIKNAADFYFASEINEPGVRSLGNWQPPIQTENISNRYFTLMTPDGNIIRISKKLSDIVGCVAGAEQDQDCLDQLKRWQQQMANPKLTNSPNNLIEILNLANSLQDK